VPSLKTDDLIRALAADDTARGPSLPGRMAVALVLGGSATTILFALMLGVRPDITSAMLTWRFVLKVAISLICCLLALWASMQLARPDMGLRDTLVGLLVAPSLLLAAIAVELLTLPPTDWYARAVGTNARVCMVAIPLLSLAPLVTVLVALRAGAPRSPLIAGATAGLFCGGLAATLYAVHCPDDSPLFVAVWYSLTVGIVMLAGALAGSRILRW
jgi:hypothetical protein